MASGNRTEGIEKARQEIKEGAFGDPARREQFRRYLVIAGPVLDELSGIGYQTDTLDDLRYQGKPWKTALPVLLRWLPKIDDPGVKESIVRCLSVPWVGSQATAELIEEFKKYAPILSEAPNPWVGNQLRETL